jgi:hypothetical protein
MAELCITFAKHLTALMSGKKRSKTFNGDAPPPLRVKQSALRPLFFLFTVFFIGSIEVKRAPAQCSGVTFGNTTAETGAISSGGGVLMGSQFVLPAPATITSMTIDASDDTTGGGILGIYADNSGSPGSLLAQSSWQSLSVGWNTFTLPPTILDAGTYWLSGGFTGDVYIKIAFTGGNFAAASAAYGGGPLPNPFGTEGETNPYKMSIYASGCGGAPTWTPTYAITLTPTPVMAGSLTPTPTPTPTPPAGLKVWPNPFTPQLSPNQVTHFLLPAGHGGGRLLIASLTRNMVRSLDFGAGADVQWDGKDNNGNLVSSGLYLYLLESDGTVRRGTVTVMR